MTLHFTRLRLISSIASTIRRYQSTLSKSYVHGASTVPLIYRTIGDILEETVSKCPDKTAFVFPQQSIRKSFGQFYGDAKKLACGLMALGVEKGDRVGMWGPNSYQWVVTQFASALAGSIFVTINPAYQAEELEFCLHKVGIKCLVAANNFKNQDYNQTLTNVLPGLPMCPKDNINFGRLPDLRSVVFLDAKAPPGCWTYEEIMDLECTDADAKLRTLHQTIQPDDPSNILFTSGTTGRPKGATLSHYNVTNNALLMGIRLGYDHEAAIICCPPPLYHCFGCVAGTLCTIIYGITCVFPSVGFDSTAALRAVQEEKCTSLYGTPTMFIDMLSDKNFKKYDYSTLSTGIMAGATCPKELCLEVIEKLNMKNLTVLYGTTENSPGTFQSTKFCDVTDRVSTVGRVHDHLEAKVVDENGQIVPIDKTGELCIRGHCVMLNYWNDEQKTDEAIGQDGWYKTGDLAEMDGTGKLKIVGRKKDLIIRGGENVYPAEVEQFLDTHPKILDAQVIGVPDKRLGEELCAWIRLKDAQECTEQEIKDYCKGKIAYFKIPRYIMFKKQADFPVTITGKIQKFKMRETATAELNL